MGNSSIYRIGMMLVWACCLMSVKGADVCPDPIDLAGCNCGQAEGFTIVKAFTIKLQDPAHEVSYVFSQGTEYQITICRQEGGVVPLHVTLLDENHHPLVNNYDKKTKHFVQQINYLCGHTAAEQIKLEPEKGTTGCAYVFISFRPL
jgi:hypothetical protein